MGIFRMVLGQLIQGAFGRVRTEPRERTRRARSRFIRHFDAGSSGDNEVELSALQGPHYDLECYGLRIVASPRHADVLLVSLPLTRNMVEPLLTTLAAMPDQREVFSIGDAGDTSSIFSGSYAVIPPGDESGYHPASVPIARDAETPPPADAILRDLQALPKIP
jgi:Ni,Fe-hydrogenase III small subunit